jgi:hypothetical protein
MYPVGAEALWKNFRHVEIAFSIDDVSERFEYQRAGADWTAVNGHVELFRQMRARNKNITLQVCTTVNVFNVMYLEDVAAWIDQQDFDFVYWNMLHDAPQFCIANLPAKAKEITQARLRSGRFSVKHDTEIQRIIDFMNQGTSTDGSDLRRSVYEVDQRRGQDLNQVAPEFAIAIDYDFLQT